VLKCPEKTEVWSRVCGFFRPVSQFNRGKKAEYAERVNYVGPGAVGAQHAAPFPRTTEDDQGAACCAPTED
jgi:ribonucleoside-triphosphate reductase